MLDYSVAATQLAGSLACRRNSPIRAEHMFLCGRTFATIRVAAGASLAIYRLVSSPNQKALTWALPDMPRGVPDGHSFSVGDCVWLQWPRAKIIYLLCDRAVQTIEHRDWLAVSSPSMSKRLSRTADASSFSSVRAQFKDDVVQDMVEVPTAFCARLSGWCVAKNRAAKALVVEQAGT